jgi:hypothetical protein
MIDFTPAQAASLLGEANDGIYQTYTAHRAAGFIFPKPEIINVEFHEIPVASMCCGKRYYPVWCLVDITEIDWHEI